MVIFGCTLTSSSSLFSMFMDGDWYDECGQQVGYKGPNRGYGGDALNFLLVPPNLQR